MRASPEIAEIGGNPDQNINFRPTNTRRSSCPVCVEVMLPKSELVGTRLGGEKFG
jgi:hypothetical protein